MTHITHSLAASSRPGAGDGSRATRGTRADTVLRVSYILGARPRPGQTVRPRSGPTEWTAVHPGLSLGSALGELHPASVPRDSGEKPQ